MAREHTDGRPRFSMTSLVVFVSLVCVYLGCWVMTREHGEARIPPNVAGTAGSDLRGDPLEPEVVDFVQLDEVLPTSPSRYVGNDDVRTTSATDFLDAQFAILRLGKKTPESFRDDFARMIHVTPPDEWCYALAFQAFVYKPEHLGQFTEPTAEFEKMLSSEGRAILRRRWWSCSELDNVMHLHTRSTESRRLNRDAVGRILIEFCGQQFALPEHALNRVPAFGCCLVVSKLNDRFVVGQHDRIGSGFPLACIDEDTQSIRWKSRVFAMPPKQAAISGFWYHNLQFVQTPTRVAAFGIVNGYCYAELFDVRTGQRLLRFCPKRWRTVGFFGDRQTISF